MLLISVQDVARGEKTGESVERNDGELSAPGGKEARVL